MPHPALLRGCRGQVGAHRQVVKAQSERVDTLVHEDVLVLKLDVEGFEPSAFQSMKGLFDSQECASAESSAAPHNFARISSKSIWT